VREPMTLIRPPTSQTADVLVPCKGISQDIWKELIEWWGSVTRDLLVSKET
jgi:hypothetical protein